MNWGEEAGSTIQTLRYLESKGRDSHIYNKLLCKARERKVYNICPMTLRQWENPEHGSWKRKQHLSQASNEKEKEEPLPQRSRQVCAWLCGRGGLPGTAHSFLKTEELACSQGQAMTGNGFSDIGLLTEDLHWAKHYFWCCLWDNSFTVTEMQ